MGNANVKKDNEAINKMNLEIHKLKADLDDTNFSKKEADSQSLASVVPTDISVSITQSTIGDSACIVFEVQAGLIIRSVIMYADKLFENGSFVSFPSSPTNQLIAPIFSDKNMS
jgi:hypothetical protein